MVMVMDGYGYGYVDVISFLFFELSATLFTSLPLLFFPLRLLAFAPSLAVFTPSNTESSGSLTGSLNQGRENTYTSKGLAMFVLFARPQ